jgi:hypothetical protein
MDERVRGLTISRMVVYRSRTAQYSVPAIITATIDTIADAGVQAYLDSGGARGVPPLNDTNNVHLTVFTPGVPGQRATADDFVGDRADERISENVAGCYQEWDVPYFDPLGMHVSLGGEILDGQVEQLPGTWTWPPRVP